MRSLVIAPDVGLEYGQDEVRAIVGILSARPLIGKIDLKFLIEHLIDHEYDYIHVVTHVGEDGVLLSDGECGFDSFARVLAMSKPRTIFINTCNSYRVAVLLHQLLPYSTIVTTIGDIADKDAYANGVAFVKAFVENEYNASKAYEKSKVYNKPNYILIPETIPVEEYLMRVENGKLFDAIVDLGQKIHEYNARAAQINEELRLVSKELRRIEDKINSAFRQRYVRPGFLIVGYFLFSLSILFWSSAYDFFEWINPYQKAFIAFLLQSIALVFFVKGFQFEQKGGD